MRAFKHTKDAKNPGHHQDVTSFLIGQCHNTLLFMGLEIDYI